MMAGVPLALSWAHWEQIYQPAWSMRIVTQIGIASCRIAVKALVLGDAGEEGKGPVPPVWSKMGLVCWHREVGVGVGMGVRVMWISAWLQPCIRHQPAWHTTFWRWRSSNR